MRIHKAISKAIATGGYIYRKGWPFRAVLMPKHPKDTIPAKLTDGRIARSWSPTSTDLVADDWEIVTEEKNESSRAIQEQC